MIIDDEWDKKCLFFSEFGMMNERGRKKRRNKKEEAKGGISIFLN